LNDRLDTAGAPLLLWQFPELEFSAKAASAPLLPGTDPAIGTTAEIDGSAACSDERLISALVAERIAKGHAEGFERGLAEGREKGYAEGIEAGAKTAQQSIAAEAHRLARILARLDAPIPALERMVEEAVAALALEVARCVIGGETSQSREHLVRLIREAVAKVPIEMGALRVVLNPADLELVRALAPEIENGSASLIGDASVEPGGCLVFADGQGVPITDMRWQPRTGEGVSQVDLTLASRWRSVMLTLFDGEDK
jgi:flagellar assembly protein FliH